MGKFCGVLVGMAMASVLGSTVAAQTVVEPEACILDTLKGNAASASALMVRSSCVRQFVRANEGQVQQITSDQLDGEVLRFFPSYGGRPNTITISFLNKSSLRVLFIEFSLLNKASGERHSYRADVDWPGGPGKIVSLAAEILEVSTTPQGFYDQHTWFLDAAWGVP